MRTARRLRCDRCHASLPTLDATVTSTTVLCPACATLLPAAQGQHEPARRHRPRGRDAHPLGAEGAGDAHAR